MVTFVLVHGSFCGAWCWRKVVKHLRGRGHDPVTPQLTGLGDRAHLGAGAVDLHLHTRDVVATMEEEDVRDAVLVGHSYSGMVITAAAAAAPGRLRSLVYLDAYLPEAGESELDTWPPEEAARARDELAKDPGATRAPIPAAALGITDPEEARWVDARMRPHPLATYAQPAPPLPPLPGAFVLCTQDWPLRPLFGKMAERARGRGWPVYEVATKHMLMMIAPGEVASLLERCAEQGGDP